ncbi:MAG: hypothetical protein IJR96_04150 [Pseudobutyrivibrio sp.]|nr:hypothetical protein [Pseudobutyrivibrio sp.]
MGKRLFAILIAATMLSTSFPTKAFAEEINDNGQPVTTDDEDEDNEDLIDQIVEEGLANQNNNPSDDEDEDNEDLIDQIVEEGLAKRAAGLEEAQTPMCEITFVDSLDNNAVFANYSVELYGSITDLPKAPEHDGYMFSHYEGNYTDVIGNEVVTAVYDTAHANISAFLFAYVDGIYTEKLVICQDDDNLWKDEDGETYTKLDNSRFEDAYGHTYFIDINYVDPNYGAISYAVSEESASKAGKKLAQDYIGVALDAIAKANPELAPFIATFKPLVGFLFGLDGGDDPNAKILNKLDDIDKHLDTMEANIKTHAEDLATFTKMGEEFQKVANAYEPLYNKIGDITGSYRANLITKEELNRQIGALYTSQEYIAMASALAGATNSYRGNTSFSLEEESIFRSAYNLKCNHVMFSGEAIDDTAPYLLRQLCTYVKGYSLINTVLDSLEASNGSGCCSATRASMLKNLGGIDKGKHDEGRPGVFGLYNDYFSSNRFIVVNKTSDRSKHVQLSGTLGCCENAAAVLFGNKVICDDDIGKTTPDIFKPIPPVYMDPVYAYCKEKNISLFDLLIDRVGFKVEWKPPVDALIGLGTPYITDTPVNVQLKYQEFIDHLRNSFVMMPHGVQNLKYWNTYDYCVNGIDAVNMNKVGASAERLWATYIKPYDEYYYGLTYTASDGVKTNDVTLLYFKPADN